MRITELIIENTQVDEISLKGIGQGLSRAADTVGGAIGGVQGQLAGMKNVYAQKRDRMAAVAQRNAERAGGYKKPAAPVAAPTPATTIPPTANAVPNSGTMSINGNKLDPKNPADAKIIAQIQAQDAQNAAQQSAPQPSAPEAPSAPAPRRLVGPKGVAAVEKAYKSLPDVQRGQAKQSIAAIDAGVKESLTVGYKSNFLGLVI
jgi:hypothetical protein